MTDSPDIARPWQLRVFCCGIPLGVKRFATWEEADAWRLRVLGGPVDAHDRVGIIEEDRA